MNDISICPHCNCMTHTIKGQCGKCKMRKEGKMCINCFYADDGVCGYLDEGIKYWPGEISSDYVCEHWRLR